LTIKKNGFGWANLQFETKIILGYCLTKLRDFHKTEWIRINDNQIWMMAVGKLILFLVKRNTFLELCAE
jgi:hypothetical protein